jgi:hypothetical protein
MPHAQMRQTDLPCSLTQRDATCTDRRGGRLLPFLLRRRLWHVLRLAGAAGAGPGARRSGRQASTWCTCLGQFDRAEGSRLVSLFGPPHSRVVWPHRSAHQVLIDRPSGPLSCVPLPNRDQMSCSACQIGPTVSYSGAAGSGAHGSPWAAVCSCGWRQSHRQHRVNRQSGH